jgi:hypothetical protein
MLVHRQGSTAVWCSERTGAELDAYFAEQYDDEDRPISALAADVGVHYYDHDWIERIECASHGHSTVGELIARTGGGEEMVLSLGELASLPARCVVVLYRAEVADFPVERDGAPHPLRFLGNIATPSSLAK